MDIESGDLDHGYFQGGKLLTKLLLRIPRDGTPGTSVQGGQLVLALVPIYGTKDAGRGLWRRVVRVCTEDAKLTENFVFSALCHMAVDGRTVLMLGAHVDDLMYAVRPEYRYAIDIITEKLLLGKHEVGQFRLTPKPFPLDARPRRKS